MVTDYQKVAALLSLDIQVTALAIANNPDMAQGLMEKLEERRLRVINDPEHRDMRYGAALMVFEVVAHGDLEESGE